MQATYQRTNYMNVFVAFTDVIPILFKLKIRCTRRSLYIFRPEVKRRFSLVTEQGASQVSSTQVYTHSLFAANQSLCFESEKSVGRCHFAIRDLKVLSLNSLIYVRQDSMWHFWR